jgi:hypothetical protein
LQGMPPLCHIDLLTPSSLLTSQICHFGEFPGVYALPAYQRAPVSECRSVHVVRR